MQEIKAWMNELAKDVVVPYEVAKNLIRSFSIDEGHSDDLAMLRPHLQRPLGLSEFDFVAWKKSFDNDLNVRPQRVIRVWDLMSDESDSIMDQIAIEEAKSFFGDSERKWKIFIRERESAGLEFGIEEAGKGIWKLFVDRLGTIKCSAKGYLPLFLLWRLIGSKSDASTGLEKELSAGHLDGYALLLKSYFFELALLNSTIKDNLKESGIELAEIAQFIDGGLSLNSRNNHGFGIDFIKEKLFLEAIVLAPSLKTNPTGKDLQKKAGVEFLKIKPKGKSNAEEFQLDPVCLVEEPLFSKLALSNENSPAKEMPATCLSLLSFKFSDGTLLNGDEVFFHPYALLIPRFLRPNPLGVEPEAGSTDIIKLLSGGQGVFDGGNGSAVAQDFRAKRNSMAGENQFSGLGRLSSLRPPIRESLWYGQEKEDLREDMAKNLILQCLNYSLKYKLPFYFTSHTELTQGLRSTGKAAAIKISGWEFSNQSKMTRWEVLPQNSYSAADVDKADLDGEVMLRGQSDFGHLTGPVVSGRGFYLDVASGKLYLDTLAAQAEFLQVEALNGPGLSQCEGVSEGIGYKIVGHEKINKIIWSFQAYLANRFELELIYPKGRKITSELIQPEFHLFHKSRDHISLSFTIDDPEFKMRVWNLPAEQLEQMFTGVNSGLGALLTQNGATLPISFRAAQRILDLKIFRHVGFFNFLLYEVLKWKCDSSHWVEENESAEETTDNRESRRKVEKLLLNRGARIFAKILKKSASKDITQRVAFTESGSTKQNSLKEEHLRDYVSEKTVLAVEEWVHKNLGWNKNSKFYMFYKNTTIYLDIEKIINQFLLALMEVNIRDLGKNSFLNQSFKNRELSSQTDLQGMKFSGKAHFSPCTLEEPEVKPLRDLEQPEDQALISDDSKDIEAGRETEINSLGNDSPAGTPQLEMSLSDSRRGADVLTLPKAKRHLLLNEAENFKFYVAGKAVEALKPEDFVTELNIGEDASGKIDWFDLDPKTFFKGKEVSKEVTESMAGGPLMYYQGHYYLLNKSEIPSLKWLDFFWEQLHSGEKPKIRKSKEDKIYQLPKSQVLDMLALRQTGVKVKGGKKWNYICKEFDRLSQKYAIEEREGFDEIEKLEIPFKNYQKLGVLWLYDLYKLNLGGILADDMGLGKTVQMLGLFELLHKKGDLGLNLIVVPTSLIYNWEFEIKKFTPQLPYEFFESAQKEHFEATWKSNKSTLIITSYGLLNNHIEFFLKFNWNTVIFDEAQNLKNISAKRTTSARRLMAHSKFCLTGTPMENHYGEFFSLLDLVVPGALGSYSDFISKYSLKPGSDGQSRWTRQDIEFLRLKTKPLILRRAKTSILTELPAKTETVIKLPLEKEQERIYKEIAISWNKRVHNAIDSKGESKSQLEMLTALLRLRQVCSYPAIVPNVVYDKRPPKVELILEAAKELLDHGESLLVFTNFLSTLEYLKSEFTNAGLDYLTLMGSMPSRERADVLQRFSESKLPKILLMTLKVGGVGLNLTKASYVFHIEPWWNPAAENQATDRVHRLGQKKPVQVYRYIMENSVEEKIQTLKKRKGLAFDALFVEKLGDLEELRNSADQGAKLTKEDFEHLLQEATY